MNKKKFFASVVAAAIVLLPAMTSCHNKIDEEVNENSKVELRLSTGVEAATLFRASFPETDKQIPYGRKVAVYVYEAGGGAPLYEKNILTADGNGGLFGGEPMYFPANGNKVDIYAYHTNAELPATLPSGTLVHTVSNNQKTIDGYASSDMLHVGIFNVARTTSPVKLNFYHCFSKLQVAVKAGDGLTAADIVGITINGTKLESEFSIAQNGSIMTSDPSLDADTSPIEIGSNVSEDFGSGIRYNDAIIVPQILVPGTAFIIVHLSTGSDLIYRASSDTYFYLGRKYIYHITANLTGLKLTTSILDWNWWDSPVSGEATTE